MSGIQLTHVRKTFGDVVAVDDVSLTVESGEFVTLLGASGSGKTTTLRMIAGLELPDGGTIQIGGRKVFDQRVLVPTHRRNIGMVFQSYAVWPHKTVYENVAFPLKQKRTSGDAIKQRVLQTLDTVELGGLEARFPSELSGGQQQRVALARALVAEPEVILFDEPLSNLDAQLRESMRVLLRALHERLNFTGVYVTHDQTEAMVLSDRIYVMNKGAIVQSGSPRSIFEQPNNLFVAEFIGQANVLPVAEMMVAEHAVRLSGGPIVRLAGSPTSKASQGQSVLVIRPHSVQLIDNATTLPETRAVNVFEANVIEAFYLGNRVRYNIEVTPSVRLCMEVVATHGLPECGASIQVRLPPEDCLII